MARAKTKGRVTHRRKNIRARPRSVVHLTAAQVGAFGIGGRAVPMRKLKTVVVNPITAKQLGALTRQVAKRVKSGSQRSLNFLYGARRGAKTFSGETIARIPAHVEIKLRKASKAQSAHIRQGRPLYSFRSGAVF